MNFPILFCNHKWQLQVTIIFISMWYAYIGDPIYICQNCKSCMWYQEHMNKCHHNINPNFQKMDTTWCLKAPPNELQKHLFQSNCKESKSYQQHIRTYNMMFEFTSPGAKIDNKYNNGRGPPNLKIQRQSCHRICSLVPPIGQLPKFCSNTHLWYS